MHTYENALSELLTKPDVVKSDGSKAVRDARKGLVVQIERVLVELEKKVMKALGVGEEEEKVEKAVVGDVRMEDCSSVAEASEIPEAASLEDMGGSQYLPTTSRIVLSQPANSDIPGPKTAGRTTEPAPAPNPLSNYPRTTSDRPRTCTG